jgi:hypothetical protein
MCSVAYSSAACVLKTGMPIAGVAAIPLVYWNSLNGAGLVAVCRRRKLALTNKSIRFDTLHKDKKDSPANAKEFNIGWRLKDIAKNPSK